MGLLVAVVAVGFLESITRLPLAKRKQIWMRFERKMLGMDLRVAEVRPQATPSVRRKFKRIQDSISARLSRPRPIICKDSFYSKKSKHN